MWWGGRGGGDGGCVGGFVHTGPWGLVWKPGPKCGGKMMSKKKPTGHEKGWFGSIQNWLNG